VTLRAHASRDAVGVSSCGNAPSSSLQSESDGFRRRDLLHGLTAVASGHRMTGLPRRTVAVPTRTQREPAAYRRNSRFLPRCRAVARSRRPHRNRCHCRVTNRPRSSPPLVCWGPASHQFRSSSQYVGPQQKHSVGHPVRPLSGGFFLRVPAQPPPVRSLVPTERRNTRRSREGGGMRSYLYQARKTWRGLSASTSRPQSTVSPNASERKKFIASSFESHWLAMNMSFSSSML
jgi:hypothetical protein